MTTNLFHDIPDNLEDELFQEILAQPRVKIERIVSRGHCSPEGFWYDQEMNEWVLLVQGKAGLQLEGDTTTIELNPGDYLLIPAHQRHRVAWTDSKIDTIWLAVHIAP